MIEFHLDGRSGAPAHGPLREELRGRLAKARAAGLDAESIEALFATTFRTLMKESA